MLKFDMAFRAEAAMGNAERDVIHILPAHTGNSRESMDPGSADERPKGLSRRDA